MKSAADYVIVGGGTAGLVIAARLSEDPSKTVIVLEGGQIMTEDPRVNIPALWTTLMGSEADWSFETVPQHSSSKVADLAFFDPLQAELNDRAIKEPQGKLLGGSSAVNGQAFIAPSQAGIDAWAWLGNPTWTWESLLPYYRKSYTLHVPDERTCKHLDLGWIDDNVKGVDGPIHVSFAGVAQNPLIKAWIDAFKSLGYNTTADPFSGKSIGAYSNASTIHPTTKTRSHAGIEYGLPASRRPNVRIMTCATAQRIVLEDSSEGVVAKGVEVNVGGNIETITANTEVILAAGAFNTPKLLELSGIGGAETLSSVGIPVVIDNSGVGENLQDHLMTGISFEVVEGVATSDPLMRQEAEAIQEAMQMYTEHKAGPMLIGGVQSSAFMPLFEFSSVDGVRRRKELFDTHLTSNSDQEQAIRAIIDGPDEATCAMFMFLAQANLHENSRSFVGQNLLPGNYVSLGLSLAMPFSRGSTHITSSNPEDKPKIDPRFFSHPLDIEIMARRLIDLERLHTLDGLKDFIKPDGQRNHLDAFLTDLDSANRYLRDTATTAYHTCGTAAMLPREKGGVVDEKLVVYGTKNLRVCDASIFPLITRGNIMSTVYAVAERAADIIKGRA
ncbi:glucose-methanol-choline oxidoreductase [Arthroderma uncinatum]|uniref:glucose-methanol-choline oxidoreductase n=1 Tax=Arthroderma uncinatum TaxID=74035 RepID=UPI00144AEA4C|nr:glucose-methanol-choline oxidoreductase [Arthroderma uncinatum]KAF3480942.1 glucose-methanol-choline oxidoreductase [Arthroderma uncinatum]